MAIFVQLFRVDKRCPNASFFLVIIFLSTHNFINFASVPIFDMISRCCAFCSDQTINSKLFLSCRSCYAKLCNCCCQEILCYFATHKSTLEKAGRRVKNLLFVIQTGGKKVHTCPFCDFSLLSKNMQVLSTSARLSPKCGRKKRVPIDLNQFNELNLHDYFNNPSFVSYKGCLRRADHSHDLGYYNYNPFEGALYLRCFNLAIEATATNSHWYCDHHALAKSPTDGTPSVPHCVFGRKSAVEAFGIMFLMNRKPCRVAGKRERILLPCVASPEDPTKRREIAVEVIHVTQAIPVSSMNDTGMKGDNNFSPEEILSVNLFGFKDIRDDVDATIILGHFTLEHQIYSPKLLLLRFSSMLSNLRNSLDERNQGAREIYDRVCSLCGKYGYELKRTGGSSGVVDYFTDKELARFVHDHPGLCPRPLQNCLILRNKCKYQILYHGKKSSSLKKTFFSPPRNGGQLKMPPGLLASYPVLAEFTYLKILGVLILKSLNEVRDSRALLPISVGVVGCEMRKLEEARKSYNKNCDTTPGKSMFDFLCRFNELHKFSMVAYSVGMHNDQFQNHDESLENKILFTIDGDQLRSSSKNSGRGGSLNPTEFAFALLDW